MENKTVQIVPRRILSSLIASVSAGVVPRAGAPYMAIGRNDEITAIATAKSAAGSSSLIPPTMFT